MPVMPFAYSKGSATAWAQTILNPTGTTRVQQRTNLLAALRGSQGGDFTADATIRSLLGPLDATVPNSTPPKTVEDLLGHLHTDWFGKDAPGTNTTGWWMNWKGDAEGIVRQTLITALELSMGLSPGQVPADPPKRSFRSIDVSWVCGPPMVQGIVTRRPSGPVNVVLVTPPPLGGQPTAISMWLFNDPALNLDGVDKNLIHATGAYVLDPTSYRNADHLVIGHKTTVYAQVPNGADTWDATYDVMGSLIVGQSPVVVLRPAVVDGGI